MMIEGGTGNGYRVKVNSDNMLHTRSVTESIEHHINHDHKRGFCISFNQSPTAANDCFFWLKNTDSERDIIIEGMSLGFKNASAVDGEVYFKLGDDGTANAGTDVTPQPMNTESAYTATCTAEKGADLDNAGAGISGGTECMRLLFANIQDRVSTYHNFPMDIILAPNGSISMWATDAGATYYVNMPIWYHDRA